MAAFIIWRKGLVKIAVCTLGCKVNQAESASMEGELRKNYHEIVTASDNPDVCIINTCTVTAKSDYHSRQMIRRAVRSGAKVIATGCYAQLRPEELSKIKGLDLIVGNSEKDRVPEIVNSLFLKDCKKHSHVSCPDHNPGVLISAPDLPMKSGICFSKRARAFLKIQDGCNFSCSYCSVPMARGKSRSLFPEDVLGSVDIFHKKGFREIVLTGIHIGSYGLDIRPESSLLNIVARITEAYPDMRFRLSSIEPLEFKKELLAFISNGSVCRHVHIPLQSGSDAILKAMNRGYSTDFFEDVINSIVSECPDISIGTDVIAGFPGESEKDFLKTIDLIERLPLSYLHVFPYSRRPGTGASLMKGHICSEVKKKRMDILLGIAKNKRNSYIKRQLGRHLNVIVENKTARPGFYRSVSDNYIKPVVMSKNAVPGQMLRVKAVSFMNGELLSIPAE